MLSLRKSVTPPVAIACLVADKENFKVLLRCSFNFELFVSLNFTEHNFFFFGILHGRKNRSIYSCDPPLSFFPSPSLGVSNSLP